MDLWKSVGANNTITMGVLYQFSTISTDPNGRITYVRNYIYGTQVGSSLLSMMTNKKG